MTEKNQNQPADAQQAVGDAAPAPRKTFVEPAISQPVDVLEATTAFQVVDSGGTGLKPKGPGGSERPSGLWVYD